MTVTTMPTRDQRAVAAIAQAVLDVDAGRCPGWQLDRWGIGHLRASGRPQAHVIRTVVQRTGPTVWAVALYRRAGQVRAMTLTVREGRVLHVEMLEDGTRWAHENPVDRMVDGLDVSPVRTLKPCGTSAAYRRHLRRGEVPCARCKAAHLDQFHRAMGGAA